MTGDWMTSCPEAIGWELWWFWKKNSSFRFDSGRGEVRLDSGPGSSAGELTVGDEGTISIVKIVFLSPRVEKLKVKKVNKRFVPEQKESSEFRDFYAYGHFTYGYFGYATKSLVCVSYSSSFVY